jgi:non-ribosomal peptide synthetase component F
VYSGQNDVVFGSVISGRPADLEGVESIVGPFINTLPVRVKLSFNESMIDVAQRLSLAFVESIRNGAIALNQIQSQAPLSAGSSLFDTIVVFENTPRFERSTGQSKISELSINPISVHSYNNYPLVLELHPSENLYIKLQYDKNIFSSDIATRVLENFCTLLKQVITSPEMRLGDYPCLSRHEKLESYWRKQLLDAPDMRSVLHIKPGINQAKFEQGQYLQKIDAGIVSKLNQISCVQDVTLAVVLQSAFAVLVSRYSQQKDIMICSPTPVIKEESFAPAIGFFINAMLLRVKLDDSPAFTELLKRTKNTVLEASKNQFIPYEIVAENGSSQSNRLFQVFFTYTQTPSPNHISPELIWGDVKLPHLPSQFTLSLSLSGCVDGGLSAAWQFSTEWYDEESIAGIANSFSVLLSTLSTDPEENVFLVDMFTPQERHQLLSGWNDNVVDYAKDKCIHELFEAQAKQNPDSIAVTCGDQSISYGELNRQANQLANYLIAEKHVKLDSLVGVCVERSLELIVSILGILKAGGGYVPLDPDYPGARLAYMVEDAHLSTVLTQSHLLHRLPISIEQAVCLDNVDVQQQLASCAATDSSLKSIDSK